MQKYNNSSEDLASVRELSGYMLLNLNPNQLRMMSKCGLSVDDVRYLPMFEEYLRLREDGAKKKQTIGYLAGKYFVSESTVKRVVKRLSQVVTP